MTRPPLAFSGLPLLLSSMLFLALSAPMTAGAQQSDDDLARHFFETGRTYFDRAQYGEAAEAFAEAYRLSGRPALLVNQARALESHGDIPGAIAALEQAERELEQDSELYPSIAPRLQRLRAQATQEGQDAAEQAAEAERAAAAAAASEEANNPPPADEDSTGGPGTLFWVGVGTAGVGAAALIASLATGIAAHGVYGDLEAACPGDVCPPEYAGDIDRGSALSTASTALLFIGAIAAGAGVTLMLLDGGGDEDDATAPTAALRVGPGSVLIDGRF